MLIEFDDKNYARKIRRLAKILDGLGVSDAQIADNFEDQETLKASFGAVKTLTEFRESGLSALPLLPNVAIPADQVAEFVAKARKIFAKLDVKAGIWGQLASGNLQIWPMLNLANLGDRQKIFRLVSEINTLVVNFGGAIFSENSGGRIGAGLAREIFDPNLAAMFAAAKKIFDPFGILNPEASFREGATKENLVRDIKRG